MTTDAFTLPETDTAVDGARMMLEGLGLDISKPHLAATPMRLVAAYRELFSPRPFQPTTFDNDAEYHGLVVVREIPLRSVCEHHLLPFVGTARIGYVPGERLLGLSKIARVLEHFAGRPQVQERLTNETHDWFAEHLSPLGIGIVIDAEHTCMTLRGARATGAFTTTSRFSGSLAEDGALRREFVG